MRLGFRTAVTLLNGRVIVGSEEVSSIRFRTRVLGLGEPPRRGDLVVDLDGAFVVPGLINAHDHLELNHYGALKRRAQYANAAEWIDDLRPLVRGDPDVRRRAALPLGERLFIGGLKNLLAGVTTVAHHNPLYRGIARDTPVRVVKRFGWAHSFGLERGPVGANGEPGGDVRRRCEATPPCVPFIVHAAEGVDQAAADELARLQTIGCVRGNTVLVHGVAMSTAMWRGLAAAGASLVWCPASNEFLFGRTAPMRELLDGQPESAARVCLGSDSRLTGSRDLLDEMRAAARLSAATPRELLRMVTAAPARILKLPAAGRIALHGPADLVVVPPSRDAVADALVTTTRSQLGLVAIGGRPMIAAPAFARVFESRGRSPRRVLVDGAGRLADPALAARIAASPIGEDGVRCA